MIKTIAKCVGWVLLAVMLVSGWTVASKLASMPDDIAVFAGFALFAAIVGTVIVLLIRLLTGGVKVVEEKLDEFAEDDE